MRHQSLDEISRYNTSEPPAPTPSATTAMQAINAACVIIEQADARNLANDGPAGGYPPQMTLREWRTLYRTLDKARRGAR